MSRHVRLIRGAACASFVIATTLAASLLASSADPPANDPDLEGILIRHDERGRFTIYEPKRRPWLPWDFMMYPVLGVNDDGTRWMNLRVKSKGDRPIGLKSLGLVLAQASSSLSHFHWPRPRRGGSSMHPSSSPRSCCAVTSGRSIPSRRSARSAWAR